MPQLPSSSMNPSHRRNISPTPPQHGHSPYGPPLLWTMSAVDPGNVFIHDNVSARFKPSKNSDNHDITAAVDFDVDAGQFITATVNSASGKVVCGHLKTRPNDRHHAKSRNEATEKGLSHSPLLDVAGRRGRNSPNPRSTMSERARSHRTIGTPP